MSKIISKRQTHVYGFLQPNKGLKKRVCGKQPLSETSKIPKLYQNTSLMHDQSQKQEIKCLLVIFTYKNRLIMERKNETIHFKKLFKWRNFNEGFQCYKIRVRNKKEDVLSPYLFTRTTLRK